MSNRLLKDYIVNTTVVQGYTVATWVPASTTTYTGDYGYYTDSASGAQTKIYAGGANGVAINGRFTANVYDSGYGAEITAVIQVVGSDTYTVTTPGHYEYTTVPDHTVTTYDPNIGWNAAAISQASLSADGAYTFSVPVDATGVVTGLNEIYDSSGTGYVEITYGLFFGSGFVRVIEQGVVKTGAIAYTTTDVFGVVRSSGEIFYTKNGTVFYKSATTSTLELLVDCALYVAGDSIFDAALSTTPSVEFRTAALTTTHALDVTPKAAALIVDNFESLTLVGTYTIDNDVHVGGVTAMSAGHTLQVLKDWGYSTFSNVNTLTGTGHGVNEGYCTITKMQAHGTSGYANYNGAYLTIGKMTLSGGSGALSGFDINTLRADIGAMRVTGHAAQGTTNLNYNLATASMVAFGADHAYNFAAVTMAPMEVYAATAAPLGNSARLTGFASSLTAHGVPSWAMGELTGLVSTVTAYGGARAQLEGPTSALTSTATFNNTAQGALTGFTSTVNSVGSYLFVGDGVLGGFTSTVTARGGAIAALQGFTSVITATGTAERYAQALLKGFTPQVSATGSVDVHGNVLLQGFTSRVTWAGAALTGFSSAVIAGAHPVVANTIAYNFNIVTEEMTRYTNFTFEHIIAVGGVFYGVKADKWYLLEGSTDAGTAINGTITTKDSDFGKFEKKRLQYLYLNSDSKTKITPYYDGVKAAAHESEFGGRRTQLGAAPIGRYWQLKIEKIKKLQGIQFLPSVVKRRI